MELNSDVAALAYGEFRREAFQELDLVHTVARLIGGRSGDVRNALPTIMLVAYRNWSERPAGLRPRAWLLSLLIDQVRSDGFELMVSDPEDKGVDCAPDGHVGEPFTLLARRAIREMRAEDREVLALCDVAELGYKEAGMVLGLPKSEVKRRLHSARERLQTRLDADSYSS